ncbi:MAG: TfoX/Sxy family DNA transformation protein [Vibrio sp.]
MPRKIELSFLRYVTKFDVFNKRSMFGGLGLFCEDAMYALISDNSVFIRGGGGLDQLLLERGCKRYRHVKKQSVTTVNYFDITALFLKRDEALDDIIQQSITNSIQDKAFQKSFDSLRLRDLPNMQLTLERMLKKAGIFDVNTFIKMEPEEIFKQVQKVYGTDVDIRLLWKLAGAKDGCHWKLIQEPRKQQLLSSISI